MRGDQHQPQAYQSHHGIFDRSRAFFEQQPLEQHGKGREAGKAEGGDGHARDMHRLEKTPPVSAQQQAAEGQ